MLTTDDSNETITGQHGATTGQTLGNSLATTEMPMTEMPMTDDVNGQLTTIGIGERVATTEDPVTSGNYVIVQL